MKLVLATLRRCKDRAAIKRRVRLSSNEIRQPRIVDRNKPAPSTRARLVGSWWKRREADEAVTGGFGTMQKFPWEAQTAFTVLAE